METLFKKFPFLVSTRFWAIVAMAASMWLYDANLISRNLSDFIWIVCGGHVGVRTVDRFSEKMAEKQPDSPVAIRNEDGGNVDVKVSNTKKK